MIKIDETFLKTNAIDFIKCNEDGTLQIGMRSGKILRFGPFSDEEFTDILRDIDEY